MRFEKKDDSDPGVSVVVGFILVIAIAMLGLTVYQQKAVPKQEKANEIQHHRKVINQLKKFQSAVIDSSTGEKTSSTLKPGLTYGPPASLFVHSPPSSGVVKVSSYDTINETVVIENAKGAENSNSKTFWDGDTVGSAGGNDGFKYSSSYFSYTPQYRHFYEAPSINLEYGILYKKYPESVGGKRIALTNQRLFPSNKTIQIIMMSGDIHTARVSQTNLKVKPVSASKNSIQVTNTTNKPIKITIPSKLSPSKWRQLLKDSNQMAPKGTVTEVTSIDSGPEQYRIQFTLETGRTYELKLSKLYITTETSRTQVDSPPALYASWDGNTGIAIRENSYIGVDASALDIYNNPVSGVEVVSEAVEKKGQESWPEQCYGGYESAKNNPNRTECEPKGKGDYQRGLKTTDLGGDLTFTYIAPNVKKSNKGIELRVCLKKYLYNGGVDLSECKQVEGNRRITSS